MDEIEDVPASEEGNGESNSDRVKSAVAGAAAERRNSFSIGRSGVGVSFMMFVLGFFCAVPLIFFGFDYFVKFSAGLFGFLLGLLGTGIAILILVLVFRRPIWQGLYKRGEVEVEKMAAPLADVARAAAEQKLDAATEAAKIFAEMVLARYAWITTRRWLVGSITGLLAAIAALAGSTLLFQQNKLLAEQSVLIAGQTQRLDQQNFLLETQIALAEAERSALIGPEILKISAEIGDEAARLVENLGEKSAIFASDLSPALRGRIVALTNIARPYRYLTPGEIDPRDPNAVLQKALAKRPDMLKDKSILDADALLVQEIKLIDRPVSPERGQIISILQNARLFDTELLSFQGADFSFAEFRMNILSNMTFRHAFLNFASFTRMNVMGVKFGAAELEHAAFTGSTIWASDFGGIPKDELEWPYANSQRPDFWATSMTGAGFGETLIVDSALDHVIGLVMDFEGAALKNVDFSNSSLGGSIFKDSILLEVNFAGTLLHSIDLQGAWVFDANILDMWNQQAAPDSFRPDRWMLEARSLADLEQHPGLINLSNYVDSQFFATTKIWQIVRNPNFVQQSIPASEPPTNGAGQ